MTQYNHNFKIETKNIAIYNPWYQNKDFLFKEKKFTKRKQYLEAQKYLNKELIISLIGLRRTGKTTIIRQLINSLLTDKNKIKPEQIFFFSFDEENINLEVNLDFKIMFYMLLFAFLVGMISGAIPAYQASKLRPVDALRYE